MPHNDTEQQQNPKLTEHKVGFIKKFFGNIAAPITSLVDASKKHDIWSKSIYSGTEFDGKEEFKTKNDITDNEERVFRYDKNQGFAGQGLKDIKSIRDKQEGIKKIVEKEENKIRELENKRNKAKGPKQFALNAQIEAIKNTIRPLKEKHEKNMKAFLNLTNITLEQQKKDREILENNAISIQNAIDETSKKYEKGMTVLSTMQSYNNDKTNTQQFANILTCQNAVEKFFDKTAVMKEDERDKFIQESVDNMKDVLGVGTFESIFGRSVVNSTIFYDGKGNYDKDFVNKFTEAVYKTGERNIENGMRLSGLEKEKEKNQEKIKNFSEMSRKRFENLQKIYDDSKNISTSLGIDNNIEKGIKDSLIAFKKANKQQEIKLGITQDIEKYRANNPDKPVSELAKNDEFIGKLATASNSFSQDEENKSLLEKFFDWILRILGLKDDEQAKEEFKQKLIKKINEIKPIQLIKQDAKQIQTDEPSQEKPKEEKPKEEEHKEEEHKEEEDKTTKKSSLLGGFEGLNKPTRASSVPVTTAEQIQSKLKQRVASPSK